MQKNRLFVISIAIFLAISMSASMMLIPNASAHNTATDKSQWNIPTFAHIYAATNPIGVGERAYVYLFLTPTYPDESVANDYRFHNYKLIITDPDGIATTQTWETVLDTTSNQGYGFVPTKVGTYNLTFIFPGQYVNDYSHSPTSQYLGDYFLPSNASTTLTVTQAQISYLPLTPLPNAYWTRPIFGENTQWFVIASNWLGSGMPGYGGATGPNQRTFAPDAVGSLTAHIVWTKPVGQVGGIVGGDLPSIQGNTWFEGTAYAQRYVNPIIVNGFLYYQEPFSFNGGASFFGGTGGPVDCVNLFTGELVWSRSDIPAPSFGYVQDMENPDYHGVRPAMLVAAVGGYGGPSSWQVYDAATGSPLFNVTGIPSGTTVIGPSGEQIKYNFYNNGTNTNPDWYLTSWNSSRFWGLGSMQEGNLMTTTTTTYKLVNSTYYEDNVLHTTSTNVSTTTTQIYASSNFMYDYLNANTQNQSISWRNSMPAAGGFAPSIVGAIYGDILLCRNGSYPSLGAGGQQPYTYFAVNLNASKGAIGQVLWWNTVQPPAGNITTVSFAGLDPAGYFAETYRQTQQFVFYNLRTGALIKTAEPQAALDYYGSNGPGTLSDCVAYGRLYSSAYSGVLYCYDMSTGNVLWTYGNGHVPGNDTYSGFQVPGPYPTFINAIGNGGQAGTGVDDGVIYTVTTEHTFETPIYKGALARAINASDGTELWTLPAATGEFFGESYAIADGYSNFLNSYDEQIYTLGRGPTQLTVQAGPKSSTLGGNIVIEGTVMDISPGTKQTQQAADFPNGIPVSSDSTMTEWMSYVYQQQPMPTNFTGVPVTISVVDSNGNYRTIGTATTDNQGNFNLVWTPDISGNYWVYANFAGTNAYWPSSSETLFNVLEQPQATSSTQPVVAQQPIELYVIGVGIAIIIAIAIVGTVILMTVRKRP